ncbi:unnamed protein product [Strongylus vulgaris]|uniref:RRM domain-containing protein n=1 Tax=Strongylus vulgaris TaxID=40348 RepID=A0A3P7KH66_STRVU|nr:unnamed protein product [Strongylus vulgaris]
MYVPCEGSISTRCTPNGDGRHPPPPHNGHTHGCRPTHILTVEGLSETSPTKPRRMPSVTTSAKPEIIVYDRETGRPKGFGFCEFSDEAGAQNAVNTLNGADFNGRSLRVNWANKN